MKQKSTPPNPKRQLLSHLYRNNMRCTDERIHILEAVMELGSGFVPNDVINQLEESGFHVCLPTVYNNLSLLCEAGILTKSVSIDGKACYVIVGDSGPRVKLVCTSCGKVKAVEVPEIASTILKRRYRGFSPSGFQLRVEGLCTKCRNRIAAEEAGDMAIPGLD